MRKHAAQDGKLAEEKCSERRTQGLPSVQYLSVGSYCIVEPALRHIIKNYLLFVALAKLSSESESQMSASDAQLHGCG